MLTRSEIDLLRRDLKSALEVVGQDEIDDAEGLLREHGFRGEDFEILQQGEASSSFPSPIAGVVHVVRKEGLLAKSYRADSGSSWLGELEKDLKSGLFGPASQTRSGTPRQASATVICEAIRRQALLEFHYHGRLRVVAPYCHGVSTRGAEVLRAIQVRGLSASGRLGSGKLWSVSDMVGVRILDETFKADDPNYNPHDSAMKQVHCRV
jgi:hypothetical protein